MPNPSNGVKKEFIRGSSQVSILQGDILHSSCVVDAIVSTDDNYLTMDSGLARLLREKAGPEYIQAARQTCPIKAGSVVDTEPYDLVNHCFGIKRVLHAAVIDYDNRELQTPQIVYQATLACLERAEDLLLNSIIFPALATGAGGLSFEACAEQMCTAIKRFIAEERFLKQIFIMIYLPEDPVEAVKWELAYQEFLKQANQVLDVPYDPSLGIRQARDFLGRQEQMKRLEAILTTEDQPPANRHAVILGGPQTGKWMLLDQLFFRAQDKDSLLGKNRRFVKVTFGQVHENTSVSFVYRKFLCAFAQLEQDIEFKEKIRCAYLEQDLNCELFLKFLDENAGRYSQVVFLIDKLPDLIKMEGPEDLDPPSVVAFWKDLDRLEDKVRFVYTATNDRQYELLRSRLQDYTTHFKDAIEEIHIGCVDEEERDAWVTQLFEKYLGELEIPDVVYNFVAEEGGYHPYLISLACHALIVAVKRRLMNETGRFPQSYDSMTWDDFIRQACETIQMPRFRFFENLLKRLEEDQSAKDDIEKQRNEQALEDLRNLALAIGIEERRRLLAAGIAKGDPNAMEEFQQLDNARKPRLSLHPGPGGALSRLEEQGYVVQADNVATVKFMSPSFAAYLAKSFGLFKSEEDRPMDVVISLISQRRDAVRTLFAGSGARVISAEKPLRPMVKKEFMEQFGKYVRNHLHPDRFKETSEFNNVEEISKYILTQFTTVEVKRYLDNPPKGCTIFFTVDDEHKDIPWELMLEAAYGGEIPFRVGRSIISRQAPQNLRPAVRGLTKVKALLIGNPTGDLEASTQEVEDLCRRLARHSCFDEPDVLIGPDQIQTIRVLSALSSGKYGLVHYSGHTTFNNEMSAWHLMDGDLTTDMLTNAMQMAPPAFVFSSSCESAEAGKANTIRYEDQSFDLPGAFLQAGVEAYIGSLWEVESSSAASFVEKFYNEFLHSGENLGECLRRAKWDRKQTDQDDLTWLSFILYGDPRLKPDDIFPAFKRI